jgi:predicted nucleic acid-binding protein
MAAPKKPLAVDSNLLFNLAGKKDFALTFLELAKEKNYTLHLPPTVVQELTFAVLRKSGEEQKLALAALQNLRAWGIVPFDLVSVGHGITEQFARRLHELKLLPEAELNDGLILAETGLAGIPLIVSSDKHLLDIEADELARVCRERHIAEVSVVHPRKLLKAWGS